MDKLIFRASSVGRLLTDAPGYSITAKQLETIAELEAKQKLTLKQKEELDRLISKRDAPEHLSEGAKTYVREVWRAAKFGYYLPVNTDVLTSGKLSEQRSLALLDTVLPSVDFRSNNKERRTDSYFTGELDVLLPTERVIEDVKSSYTLKSFDEVEKPDRIYVAQAQVYMHLWDMPTFRLHYCLVPTPEWIVENEIRRNSYMHPGGYDDPQHIKDAEQIRFAHSLPERLNPHDCVKTFIIHRNDAYIEKLKRRIDMAREYASTLSLRREPETLIIEP